MGSVSVNMHDHITSHLAAKQDSVQAAEEAIWIHEIRVHEEEIHNIVACRPVAG
jgi:hypothetical protein